MAEPILLVEDLHATVEGKEILRGVDLKILPDEIHAIMGPNGSGKSTLANVLMGKPGYEIAQGRVVYKGEDLSGLAPAKVMAARAASGDSNRSLISRSSGVDMRLSVLGTTTPPARAGREGEGQEGGKGCCAER